MSECVLAMTRTGIGKAGSQGRFPSMSNCLGELIVTYRNQRWILGKGWTTVSDHRRAVEQVFHSLMEIPVISCL